ncbi:hypothetical protein RRG08_040469 [Elysia crispata]|uniref:Uncharacterized protein n=1 Tax=Elysia crispata TaxID=231223 RepID=A0AAE1DEH9_9GAST|nr:hypothetical protein RRG08_040469 [Elysia crispata]
MSGIRKYQRFLNKTEGIGEVSKELKTWPLWLWSAHVSTSAALAQHRSGPPLSTVSDRGYGRKPPSLLRHLRDQQS